MGLSYSDLLQLFYAYEIEGCVRFQTSLENHKWATCIRKEVDNTLFSAKKYTKTK
jgi:hypothetical protein